MMDRRSFLSNTGLALGAATISGSWSCMGETTMQVDHWSSVRSQFLLDPAKIHMSPMLLSSHPKRVRDAIDLHRRNLEANPAEYYERNVFQYQQRALEAAARYIGAKPGEIALTDSTTMGLGLLYSGLMIKEGDDILSSTHDHYSTQMALEYAGGRNGASLRKIQLYSDPSKASVDEILTNLANAILPNTRIIALTWVHSSTGVKLPIPEISSLIKTMNVNRLEQDRIYFCVDGVHGFGIENVEMKDLGCDFFVAGTHKWIFGPRGTGIIYAKENAWDMVSATIPAFQIYPYMTWMGVPPTTQKSFFELNTPGGFHTFEHRWALNEAFEFHFEIGKEKIESRTRYLNRLLKEGMRDIAHLTLHTPLDDQLSAAINCFSVNGMQPGEVVDYFAKENVVSSASPYRISYPRLTPGIINTEEEIKTCLDLLRKIKS